MKKIMIAALGVAVTAGMASAAVNAPLKAKTTKGEFVTAYNDCNSPTNDSTNSPLVLPGCGPAALSNSACTFGSKGSGKYAAAVSKTDIKVSGVLAGLICPDGTVLDFLADAKVTTTDCQINPDCTLLYLSDFPTGSGTVNLGKASVKTTTETAIGLGTQVFKEGEVIEIDLGSIDVLANTPTPGKAFASGIKVGPK